MCAAFGKGCAAPAARLAAACAHENHSFAMLCAWETVARLDEVCARTFASTAPGGGTSRNANNTFYAAHPGANIDLFACDEHAFCASCSAGNAYCDAVASYYGGVGVPLRISFKSVINYTDGYISGISRQPSKESNETSENSRAAEKTRREAALEARREALEMGSDARRVCA